MPVHSTQLAHRVIIEWTRHGSVVLDLGCGNGELLSELVDEKKVIARGIEIDEQAIHNCIARGLSVFQQDIEIGLSEYADNSFDYVILNQSLQQVRKPEFVIKEARRVGKKTIVGLPNFAHSSARFQIFFRGKVPVTPALPYEWYDTPNLHFLSLLDFMNYCKTRRMVIEKSVFIRKNKEVRIFPNFFAETGLFLLSK
ncbi:MAG: methionine biosynthesis protein MetW [Candidatus Bathyarchaeota archaeon]